MKLGRWNATQRALFRFLACYLALYGLFNGNLSTFPLSLVAPRGHAPAWSTAPETWIAHATALVLRLHTDSVPDANGDALGDWLLVVGLLGLSVLAAGIWSLLPRARERADYRRELPWLLAGFRFVLAGSVSAYAFWKVVPAQFSGLDPTMYFHTYGQASPMGLLWMFMGACPAYEMFAGWMELAGAALLLFRRTALAGALLLLVVLGNVVALDLAFDVDAKLCVIHLWLMALAIAAPSLGRLIDVVILHRSAPAVALGPPSTRVARALKAVFVGAYDVTEMRCDGAVVPPLLTDPTYWQHVAFGRPGAAVYLVSGKRRGFALATDAAGRLQLAGDRSLLAATRAPDGTVQLEGTLDGALAAIRLVPTAPSNSLLVTRGFHWINQGPFMR